MKNKKLNETEKSTDSCEQTRRNFLKKYGKLAVATPVALTTLMSPKTSHAVNSNACNNNGNGNGNGNGHGGNKHCTSGF